MTHPAVAVIQRIPMWAVFGGLLLVSLAFNAHQWRKAGIVEATAPMKLKIDALEATATANTTIATMRVEHDNELAAARANASDKAGKREIVYRDSIQRVLVPTCPPGADRVDAWNAIGQGSAE